MKDISILIRKDLLRQKGNRKKGKTSFRGFGGGKSVREIFQEEFNEEKRLSKKNNDCF